MLCSVDFNYLWCLNNKHLVWLNVMKQFQFFGVERKSNFIGFLMKSNSLCLLSFPSLQGQSFCHSPFHSFFFTLLNENNFYENWRVVVGKFVKRLTENSKWAIKKQVIIFGCRLVILNNCFCAVITVIV